MCPWLSDPLVRDVDKTTGRARCCLQWSDACSLESEPVFSGRRKRAEQEGSSLAALPPSAEGSPKREGGWEGTCEKVEG